MAKRRSEEARMIEYFTTAPVEKVELMSGLLRDIVRRRTQPTRVEKVAVKRKPKVKTNAAGAGTQTSFSPEAMGTAN